MKALLPEGFDLAQHLAQYPPSKYSLPKFNPDHALYILSQITLVPARNKEIADDMEDGLTPLYSKLLQKVVRDYNDYLAYFVKTGVVYTNWKFKPSTADSRGHSRGYCFVDRYKAVEIVRVDYSLKFVRQLRKKRRADFQELQPDYGHLTKWIWPENRLRIDAPVAIKYLKLRRQAQINNPELIETKIHKFGYETRKDPELQYKHAKANVDCLLSGDIGCTVDKRVGRMHTVLTNIKSDLRNLITYDGKPLVSIDIKNSQPYLSTLLLDPFFWDLQGPTATPLTKPTFKLKLKGIDKEMVGRITNPSLILALLREVAVSQDLLLYIELVSAKNSRDGHDLYTYMMEQSAHFLNVDFTDRGHIKKGMFEVLFSKNSNPGRTGVKKLFKDLFPTVNPLFCYLKEEDHSFLPCLLQRIESHIMLKIITKVIHRKHPNIPLFTIHDSITTTVEHKEIVLKIMEMELTRIVGLPPKLSVDEWSPEKLQWEKYAGSARLRTTRNWPGLLAA